MMHQMKQYDLNFSNMQLFHKLTKKTFLFQIYVIDSADRKRFEETGQVCNCV